MNLRHRNRNKADVPRTHFLVALFFCLFVVLILAAFAKAEEPVILHLGQSTDVLAVSALIDRFDSKETVITINPATESPVEIPAFVAYATACAKLSDATPLLAEVLGDVAATGQVRMAAAVALSRTGPEAIGAEPALNRLLAGTQVERRMAAGVIQGIGPAAASLVPALSPNLYSVSGDFHTQYWTCRALGAIGPEASHSVPDLAYLCEYGVASVRRNACLAIGLIAPGTDMEAYGREVLEKSRHDWIAPVRDAAEEGLANFHVNIND